MNEVHWGVRLSPCSKSIAWEPPRPVADSRAANASSVRSTSQREADLNSVRGIPLWRIALRNETHSLPRRRLLPPIATLPDSARAAQRDTIREWQVPAKPSASIDSNPRRAGGRAGAISATRHHLQASALSSEPRGHDPRMTESPRDPTDRQRRWERALA